MANWYVWSGATGGGTGVDWANAYTTLNGATSVKASGDVFYVAHDHVETAAAAIAGPGSDSTPCRIYCVNRAGSVPPVSADLRKTAQVGSAGATMVVGAGFSEIYGIIFSAGNGSATTAGINLANTAQRSIRLVGCHLKLNNSSTSSVINCPNNGAGARCVLEDTTVEFGNVLQSFVAIGRATWRNTPAAIVGANVPTILLKFGGGSWFVEGVDLSAMVTGKTVFGTASVVNAYGIIKDCKLGAGGVISNTGGSAGALEAICIRCDSGDTNYRTEKWTFTGTQTIETTIVRTGGATDGTTPVSWKIVTAGSAKPELPFDCLPISIWNETVGTPVTVTVFGTKSGGLPNNGQVWIDVEYLGTSGFPLGQKATCGKADGLATTVAYSADSSVWGGATDEFAMSVTITPEEKGPLTIYPRLGVASTTMYIDPKPVLS